VQQKESTRREKEETMKVGMVVAMQNHPNNYQADHHLYWEECKLADLAEPLGFDSLWAVEHHFDNYAMIPDVVQFLTYMAGRTSRIQLGTAVIVLPWHDPVRVAEQIAMLDILSQGRLLVGFGRGAAKLEYDGFRIPMEEARERFIEAAEIVVNALKNERFSHQGKYFQIPEMSIRPRPYSDFTGRLYGAAISPESAEIMAKLGIGVLSILQRDWDATVAEIERYNAFYHDLVGQEPIPPVVAARVIIGDTDEEARALARKYIAGHWEMADRHYGITRGDHRGVRGYEHYSKIGEMLKQLDPEVMTENLINPHVFGTPETCLQRVRLLQEKFKTDHFVAIFSDGGIPSELAERSLRRFAAEVLPELKRGGERVGDAEPVQPASN
jgi:alkanesulfonate monooxygenase SsuD/methylene tetrahydromethanopterin reductase-like flavin-dependent oxidoreductase (luciferase family)